MINTENIYNGNGIIIEKRDDKYILICDTGELWDRIEEFEITLEEVELAKISSMNAYYIVITHQNEKKYGKEELERNGFYESIKEKFDYGSKE